MKYLKGYSADNTDYSALVFLRDEEEICRINAGFIGDVDISVTTHHNKFITKISGDSCRTRTGTVMADNKRFVKDKNTGENVYYVIYRSRGYNDIVFHDTVISARFDEEGYYFSCDGKDIACIICQKRKKSKFTEMSMYTYNLCYAAILLEEFEDDVLAAILSFPFVKYVQ